MTTIAQLAAQQGLKATELAPEVWMLEAQDDTADWAVEQDEATLEQRMAAGRLQATGGGA